MHVHPSRLTIVYHSISSSRHINKLATATSGSDVVELLQVILSLEGNLAIRVLYTQEVKHMFIVLVSKRKLSSFT